MTARGVRPGAGDAGDLSSTRTCQDCVPPLVVQAGVWGWKAHRYALHGEGGDPGPHPRATPAERKGKPWTEADRAEFHRRRVAARRQARSTPPATPRPPRSSR